jgi:HlyD family secretion protein
MRTGLVILAVLVASSGGWFGYSKFLADDGAGQYLVQPLDRGSIVKTISATGTIEPLVKVIVGTEVSGKITRWHADFNAKVTKGFVLAEIDPERFQTALEQAAADLALAQAREEELGVRSNDAQRELRRIQDLFETNIASENEMLVAQAEGDAVRAAHKGAVASVQAATARLNAAKVDLDRTIIRSPIDGVVISRSIDVGQTVAASFQTPELFFIANDLTRMQVNANVSESDIGMIAEGLPADFRVDAYPGRTFQGTISQIRYNANVVDGVVTYVTLIEVSNEDLALRPGMTANVTFEVARAEDVIRIPNAALRFDPAPRSSTNSWTGAPKKRRRKPTVYLLEAGRPRPREIEVGLSDGRFTALTEGDLAEGTEVITERNYLAQGGRRPDVTRSLRRGRR